MASAFVKSHVFRRVFSEAAPTRLVSEQVDFSIATGHISTALHGVNPQIAEACFTYFESIKVPSALIAGFALTALFTFTREVQETYNFTKLEVMLLRCYHMFSLFSFCLSLTAVLTSQAATTSLLFNSKRLFDYKGPDAYTFLRANMNFEFLLIRWTTVMSILSFFVSTIFRVFVEFGLFSRTRRTAGTMVSSMMLGFICFLISFVNTCQVGLPTLWSMTKEVAVIVWHRVYIARYPLQIASVAFFGIALLCSVRFLFPGSIARDQMLDTERYT